MFRVVSGAYSPMFRVAGILLIAVGNIENPFCQILNNTDNEVNQFLAEVLE